MWGEGSEVWLAVGKLREFETREQPRFEILLERQAAKDFAESSGRQACRDDGPSPGAVALEMVKEWDRLRGEVRQSRLCSLLENSVYAVPHRKNKEPREIHESIKRTMTDFDLQAGTMSDSAGVRKFDCVEFLPCAPGGGSSLETKNRCRGPTYPYDEAFRLLVKANADGALRPPGDLQTFCDQIRLFVGKIDVRLTKGGGPTDTPIRNYFRKAQPEFLKRIQRVRKPPKAA
jgi:hypothetical protein